MITMRAWSLDKDDYPDEASFRAAVVDELAASEYLSHRLGIAVVSAPIRAQRFPGGDFETRGWLFKTATVPAIRFAEDTTVADAAAEVEAGTDVGLEPDAESDPDLEPAEVSY